MQVEARRGRSIDELLAEWEAGSDAFAEALGSIDAFRAPQSVFDAATHERDLRDAPARRPRQRAFGMGWGWATDVLGQVRDGYDAGAIELRTPSGTTVAGKGESTATVSADRFKLSLPACRLSSRSAAPYWMIGASVRSSADSTCGPNSATSGTSVGPRVRAALRSCSASRRSRSGSLCR